MYKELADFITISLPDSMIQSINETCKKDGCTSQELIKIAISKMLFEQSKSMPEPNMMIIKENDFQSQRNMDVLNCEIPLDKIVTVRYTLDDGKIIHIMRGKKIQ